MKNKNSKKVPLAAVICCVAVVAGVFAWSYARRDKPWYTQSTCAHYNGALYDPAPSNSIHEFAQDAPGIVIATLTNPDAYDPPVRLDGPTPYVRITKVLKGGKVLRSGDIIKLCAGMGTADFTNKNTTMLIFLEGMNNGVWVPRQSYMGVIPQNADKSFNSPALGTPNVVDVSDLPKLIK